jgi:hypothetical protein
MQWVTPPKVDGFIHTSPSTGSSSGTSIQLNAPDWPRISDFDGRLVALGIFVLGPCGTCVQRLAALGARSLTMQAGG